MSSRGAFAPKKGYFDNLWHGVWCHQAVKACTDNAGAGGGVREIILEHSLNTLWSIALETHFTILFYFLDDKMLFGVLYTNFGTDKRQPGT